MQIACPKCQKQLRVADSIAGKKIKCPACAAVFTAVDTVEEVVEGHPPRVPKPAPPAPPEEEFEEEAPRPRRSKRRDEDDEIDDDRPRRRKKRRDDDDDDDVSTGRRKRNPSVTFVGVLTIVLGSLTLLCGLCVTVASIGFAGAGNQGAFGGRNFMPFQAAAGLLIVFAVLVLLFGVVYLVGGIGAVQRRGWGRIVTLVAAGISGLFGLLQIFGGIVNLMAPVPVEAKILPFLINLLVGAVFITHCVMSYMVLLNRRNAREFE